MTRAVMVTNDPASVGSVKMSWRDHPTSGFHDMTLAPGQSHTVNPIPQSTSVGAVPISDPATVVIENVGDESLTERHGTDKVTVPPGDVTSYTLTDNRDEVLVTGPSQH